MSEPATIRLEETEIPSRGYIVKADLKQPAGPGNFVPLVPMTLAGRVKEEVAEAMESVPVIQG